METILDYVRRRLTEVGSQRWEAIAAAAGAPKSTPRKVMYERSNPGVVTVQPLLTYFQAVDRGDIELPSAPAKEPA